MNRFLTLAFAAILGFGLIGCGKKDATAAAGKEEPGQAEGAEKTGESAEEGEAGTAEDILLTAEAAKLAGIQTTTARQILMQGELKVPGVITTTAKGRAVVTPPVAGRITRILVAVGDNVRAGQPIATLQSGDLAQAASLINEAQRGVIAAQASAREAKSQVDLANARLRTARQVLSRQQELARAGAFAQAPLQQAQRDLNEAEAALRTAQQEEVVHRAQLERAERLFKAELISRTELEQARLQVQNDETRQQAATRQVELSRQALQRERTIADRGLLNAREVQAAEADVRAANLEVQQAKIRLASATSAVGSASKAVQNAKANYAAISGGGRASGANVTVVAPIGGVIVDRESTLGQAVERTTELCEIENLRSVWVTANVPEKDIAMARRGGRANVTVSTYPNRIFVGVIQVVGSRLDPKSRTMPVQILVDNVGGALRSDMFANVSLGVGESTMALVVPESAITEEHETSGAIVFVQEAENRFMRTPVKLGRRRNGNVEILEGLEPGAKVVVKGAFVLMSESKKGELKGDED